MLLPTLSENDAGQSVVSQFFGYNHDPNISEGEWYDEKNLTADYYPVLSTRKSRSAFLQNMVDPKGLISKGAMAYIDGNKFYWNGLEIDGLYIGGEGPKQLVSMGAYILIFPDALYFNTEDVNDFGSMGANYSYTGSVDVQLSRKDGEIYGDYTVSETAPESPQDGDMWMDTSTNVVVLKQWNSDTSSWVLIPTTYLKVHLPGVGSQFKQYDGVTLSGFPDPFEFLNQTAVIQAIDNDNIVVIGILKNGITSFEGTVSANRNIPSMDYVTECDNRLWGCKYGLVNGKSVNEIYASKLGDFKNWNCFMGISTDSYAASRGSDGPFTGAVTMDGHPLFFKEHFVEKVYPSAAGAHQIVSTPCDGVQKGCWRSLQVVNGTLYYKGISGIFAYNGALPSKISSNFGDEMYTDARAGTVEGKYFVSMKNAKDEYEMFTLDYVNVSSRYRTYSNPVWHKEDNVKAMMFTQMNGKLYWIDEDKKQIICNEGEGEVIEWSAESGVIGFEYPGNKYISRFVIRAELPEPMSSIRLQMKYDEGEWIDKAWYAGFGLRSFVIPVPPVRCDHVRIRLSGTGKCKIFSIAKYYEKGSDVFW